MKTKHKLQAVLAAGLLILGLGMWKTVEADTMVVAVTPSAGSLVYGVLISSPILAGTTGYDFGPVALGATTISTRAITVTSTGTVSEYFSMAISNTNQDNWSAINTGVPGYDQFLMLGHFVAHGNPQPANATFDVNADTMTASLPGVAAARYGQGTLGITAPSIPVDLYLQLTMPSSVKTDKGQSMTLTVNGQGS